MAESKVEIVRQENDFYVELWKVVGEKRYFGRLTYGVPCWYFVSDPLGYCELDRPCPDDYIFVICDKDGQELSRESNGDPIDCRRVLTLEQRTQDVWDSLPDKPETMEGMNDWLLSYMTKENLEKEPWRTQFCPEDNWVTFWHERTEHKVLYEYDHLGEKYCIYAVTYKHLYCECTWVEYLAGVADMDWEYPCFIKYFGARFDPVYGPLYSRREAIQRVAEAIKQVFGESAQFQTLVNPWFVELGKKRWAVREVAERLISKEGLNRNDINRLIERESLTALFVKEKESVYELQGI